RGCPLQTPAGEQVSAGAQEPGGPAQPVSRDRRRARGRSGGAPAPFGMAGAGDGRAEGLRAGRPAVRAADGTGAQLLTHARQPPAPLRPPGAGTGPVRLPRAPLRVAGGARATVIVWDRASCPVPERFCRLCPSEVAPCPTSPAHSPAAGRSWFSARWETPAATSSRT